MNEIRINKYLSSAGFCSRRQADQYVASGAVMVNGIPAECGMRVSGDDTVTVNGKVITKPRDVLPVVLAFNKPRGIVCSEKGQGAVTVNEYLDLPYRVFGVGRLDKDSEGLLLLTNDGEMANRVSKARFLHEKEYEVTVKNPVTDSFIEHMSSGVDILDEVTRPCRVIRTGSFSFNIILTQGINRQIRRMCRACGNEVKSLRRIRIMNICLGDLKPGGVRPLLDDEISDLYAALGLERQ